MVYYEETENEVIKYEVKIDREKLSILRHNIVNKCSKIKHYCYETDNLPELYFFEDNDIRNYISRKTGEKKEYFEEERDVYEITYDEYQHPKLADYIDKLLQGNLKVLSKLKKYKGDSLEKDYVIELFNESKQIIMKELNKPLMNINVDDLVYEVEYLQTLQSMIKLNEKQENAISYYNAVMKCVTLTEVDRLNKDDIKRIREFQGTSYTKKNKH